MFSCVPCDNTELSENHDLDEKHSLGDSLSGHTRTLPRSFITNDSFTEWFATSESQSVKYISSNKRSKPSSSKLYSVSISEKSVHEEQMSQTRLFSERKNWNMDAAVAPFEVLSFEVTKINSRKTEQERIVLLSAYGISNIKPPTKVSSLERWCDVLLCWKVDLCTVAIKYKKCERRYRAKSRERAGNLFNSVRLRVNAHQEHSRKLLQTRMINGLDVREKNEQVPGLEEEDFKHEIGNKIRKLVEDVLLSENSKVFKLKQDLSNFSLSELNRVKKLRMYLDQFKYRILDDYRSELSAIIDLSNVDANQYVLWVIDSVVESACLPYHIEEIWKLLNKETSDNFIWIRMLKGKPQEFFGVDRKMKSKDNWHNAIIELVNFPKRVLPSAKLQCLINTVKHIHEEARQNHVREITADNLLPIVIYVLVNASLRYGKIIFSKADQQFLNILINPDALQGEQGYYLCVFEAALKFVCMYDQKKILERFSSILRLNDFGYF
jgi:hypothetical protein